jgi:hypothetical protein
MSTKFYFLKTHKINYTNLFVAQLIKNAGPKCYGPCYYSLDNKFIKTELGEFANYQIQTSGKEVRSIDWSHSLDNLKHSLSLADDNRQILIFGNHNAEQLSIIKSLFGADVCTISVNYTKEFYPILLKNVAEYHIHLVNQGLLTPATNEQTLFLTKSPDELIEHFVRKFDSIGLIPTQNLTDADYTVFVEDFVDKIKMGQSFDQLQLPFTQESEQFYDDWVAAQSTI